MRRPLACSIRRFARDEGGAVTVEAVLWIPFFGLLLALITDTSLAFFSRAEAFRIVQTANRMYSVAPAMTTAQVEAIVEQTFRTLSPTANATTVFATGSVGRVVGTQLAYPLGEVVLFSSVPATWMINVQSMHYVEWPR